MSLLTILMRSIEIIILVNANLFSCTNSLVSFKKNIPYCTERANNIFKQFLHFLVPTWKSEVLYKLLLCWLDFVVNVNVARQDAVQSGAGSWGEATVDTQWALIAASRGDLSHNSIIATCEISFKFSCKALALAGMLNNLGRLRLLFHTLLMSNYATQTKQQLQVCHANLTLSKSLESML